jgi:putative peptide zinc metalloprotease protein
VTRVPTFSFKFMPRVVRVVAFPFMDVPRVVRVVAFPFMDVPRVVRVVAFSFRATPRVVRVVVGSSWPAGGVLVPGLTGLMLDILRSPYPRIRDSRTSRRSRLLRNFMVTLHHGRVQSLWASFGEVVAVAVWAALDRALDSTQTKPALAADVELARFSSRLSGEHAVLRQPRTDSYYRLTGPEADLAASLDGIRTVAQIAATAEGSWGVSPHQAVELVALLHRRGCLTAPAPDALEALGRRLAAARAGLLRRTWATTRSATITVGGVPALTDFVYRHGGRLLFSPVAAVLYAPLVAAGLILVVTERHQFTLLGRPTATTAATLWALTLVAIVVHEMGHALAIRHAGRRILGAGFGLYFGNPVFFINSSDMVMASPRARAVNAGAGPLADFVLAGAAAIAAAVLGPTAWGEVCYRFAGLTFVFAAINLFPLLELDGYWLVTDLLDVPDLRPRAWAFLRQDLRSRWRSRTPLSRGEWGLVLFGVGGAVATVAAVVLAVVFWWPLLTALVSGLWRSGWPGRCALVVLVVLAAGPVATGLVTVAVRVGRWAAAGGKALRFRLQQRWRIAAAEMVAALPQTVPLGAHELGDLAGRVQRRRFTAGQTLVGQGEPATAFYLLRRGCCTMVETDHAGHDVVLARLHPGQSFGDHALRAHTLQPMTVRAETGGEVFAIDAGTFGRLLAAHLEPFRLPAAPRSTRPTSVHSAPSGDLL